MSASRRPQKLLRLLATVRHLKLRQVVYQFWYRAVKRKLGKPFTVPVRALSMHQPWIMQSESWDAEKSFTFLNETRSYESNVPWHDAAAEKLWLYNLHYFDFLQAGSSQHYRAACTTLIADWHRANVNPRLDAWEPYPTSLRIVNWIKFHQDTKQLDAQALASLAQQAQWLAGGLEYHIMANHLFANAKALVFAGIFFEGQQANRWLSKGLSIVNAELQEQILCDGAHFERSPMYHSILLEDLLDLINLARVSKGAVPPEVQASWLETARKMLSWFEHMLHPDQGIAFFNDAALGIAAESADLVRYAESVDIDVKLASKTYPVVPQWVEESGYVVLNRGPFNVIANVAPIEPEYQPGHAHADTLSCEVSFGQERVFVNAGTSTYKKGPLRDWQRSTAAHNTVEINQQNSSDVWDGFRVARRAHLVDVQYDSGPTLDRLAGSHNGYRHLTGAPIHTRVWELTEGMLRVEDTVAGPFSSAVVRWLIHPDVQVSESNQLLTAAGARLLWTVQGGEAVIKNAKWYPEFGVQRATQCIEISMQSATAKVNATATAKVNATADAEVNVNAEVNANEAVNEQCVVFKLVPL